MANSIRAFMRNKAKEEEIVKVLAPKSFLDEKGERAVLEIKRLSTNHVNKVYSAYHHPIVAKDENGNIIVRNGKVVKDVFVDEEANINRLIVDALVFPDLHNKELMDFYGCSDVMDMPHAVFASTKEYRYVSDIVLKLAGTLSGEECKDIINKAKN